MRRGFLKNLAGLALFSLIPIVNATELSIEAAKEVLQKIDLLRQPSGTLELFATISTLQNGKEIDADSYSIKSDGIGNALLFMLNKEKRGQKVLNTDQGVWVYFPKTRRPIRLTPMQQLHGNASVGDVLHVRWSTEYTIKSVSTDTVIVNEQKCKAMRLEAAQENASYARVDLYINETKWEPVKADLYTFGGKLLKTVYFSEPSTINGKKLITQLRISNALDSKANKETLFNITSINNIKVSSEQFTLHALEVGR
ncbi:outer membrane lipoprotein-sorting protein [Undibacterium flavidum]|uniref:Outer membrane lipoprotein-sorting protein n=1 Tax=Undibacterium flavidum TaxID=2762297 RepID=A0ABR6YB00_9BURK|nr:outer membrane lipoprotein-sorting protein [Undibacterium flavidum]MBC3873808.1 outer membrane lipoprotein-sorting protein [Undibacterium flavidum]